MFSRGINRDIGLKGGEFNHNFYNPHILFIVSIFVFRNITENI